MKFIRKHKVASIVVMIVLVFSIIITSVFGAFIYNIVNNFILETLGFYFNSNVLTADNRHYLVDNWDGITGRTFEINVSNRKDSNRITNSDINYVVSIQCPSNFNCSCPTGEQTLLQSVVEGNTFSVSATPVPGSIFVPGDTVNITVSVSTTYPYTKTISATYVLKVIQENFTYSIEDSVKSNYLNLNIVNSVSYYKVSTPFDSYNTGDLIDIVTYESLSDESKNKVFSAIVSLSFDPSIVILDMTNYSYIHRIAGSEGYTVIDGNRYVSSYSFKLNASSGEKVLFYKKDRQNDYTYPITNSSSVVNVSASLASSSS